MAKHPALSIVCSLLVVILTACGGGGESPKGPSYSITLDKANLSFTATAQGALPAAQTVKATFVGDGVLAGYPPGTTPASEWLNVSAPGTATGGSAVFTVGASSTYLTPGVYTTTLRFVTGKADGSAVVYKDLPVTYTLHDHIVPSLPSLTFTSVAGATQILPSQALGITTRKTSTAWQATVDQPWVTLDKAQGVGSSSISVQVDPASLGSGSHEATLTIQPLDGGQATTVPIHAILKARRITVSRNGLALSSVPGQGILRRSVTLFDNLGGADGVWTASSDQAWLHIESITQNRLTVVADPTDLPIGMSYASVAVQSLAPKVENGEVIRVGLWKTATAPTDGALGNLAPTYDSYGQNVAMAMDPIRPWLYVARTTGSVVEAFNVYTGAVDATFPPVADQAFTGLVASSDGRYLFAASSQSQNLFRLDLDSGSWNTEVSYPTANTSSRHLVYLRPEGRPVVLLMDQGLFVDAATGSKLSPTMPWGSDTRFTVAEDQIHLYGNVRYRLEYDPAAKTMQAIMTHIVPLVAGFTDVAINRDGTRMYTNWGPNDNFYSFSAYAFDPAAGFSFIRSLPGAAYPTAVEVGDNGVLYAGMDRYYDEETVYAYAPDGTRLATYSIGTYKSLMRDDQGLMLSSDGQRLILVSTTQAYGPVTSLWSFRTQP